MHGSNLHLVVTRFFILFFKKTFEKDQKNKQNKLKTYVLDIFVSFLMSFLKNLKLKNLISMLLVFSAFIESKLMLSFFKNQNTKKEKKEKGKKCIHYFSNLIVIMEEREWILELKTLSPSNLIFNQINGPQSIFLIKGSIFLCFGSKLFLQNNKNKISCID